MHARSTPHLAFGWLVLSGEETNIKKLLCFLLTIQSLSVKEVTESCPSLQTPCQIQLKLVNLRAWKATTVNYKQTNILSVISYIMINTSVAYNSALQQTLTQALAHMSKIYCNFRNSSRFRKEWERESDL